MHRVSVFLFNSFKWLHCLLSIAYILNLIAFCFFSSVILSIYSLMLFHFLKYFLRFSSHCRVISTEFSIYIFSRTAFIKACYLFWLFLFIIFPVTVSDIYRIFLKLTSAYPARLARSIWQWNLLCAFVRYILVLFLLSCYWHLWSKIIILILLPLLSHLNSFPIRITIFFFSLLDVLLCFPPPSLQVLFPPFNCLNPCTKEIQRKIKRFTPLQRRTV